MSKINLLLKEKKLNFSKIGKKFGISPQAVGKWFARGNIPTKYILPLSKELNITAEELLKMITE